MNAHLTRSADAGFTLLEVLVALAVMAVGAVSLLAATQTHVMRISQVEARIVARWVAENGLSALRLGLDVPERGAAMGQDWVTTIRRTPTPDPDLARVDIAVAAALDGREVFLLTGFVDSVAAAEAPE
ncbi:type II secretion system minor pseudopilin GspI [Oceaniovalibus sp. ACAM 378]|uniref:type II secretion system minor pseudopilin GspI n=1 Tax=Oceaniovalibus sp. ACAM 378 TaxID=2599923 RepID=UPI001651F20F|nr:type II secretion system minor pseudopilin GspI [Oceaniovalibus sp. ACAM 378]